MIDRRSTLAALIVACAPVGAMALTVDFEDLALAPDSAHYKAPFASRGASFSNAYTDWGGGFESWTGFAYSNKSDTTTPGFLNQFSAITGAGRGGGGIYGVSYAGSPGDAVVALPVGFAPIGVFVTNTTYAYWSMRTGDLFAKRFGGHDGNDPDWFRLVAVGYAGSQITGQAEIYLADYRFDDGSQDYLLTQWTWFDLTPLGAADRIVFQLDSSDVGPWGMNTPAYFALDDLRLASVPVPEPAALALSAAALGWAAARRRGGRR
ncbi:MAG: DUF4465 domain-containing protein [Fimbriimonadales bacterium]|nr:DUF4465 domain-containing protein [Fimbriimonadales bacterium]